MVSGKVVAAPFRRFNPSTLERCPAPSFQAVSFLAAFLFVFVAAHEGLTYVAFGPAAFARRAFVVRVTSGIRFAPENFTIGARDGVANVAVAAFRAATQIIPNLTLRPPVAPLSPIMRKAVGVRIAAEDFAIGLGDRLVG